LEEVESLQTKQASVIPVLNPELINRLLSYEIRQVFSRKNEVYYVRSDEDDDIFNTSLLFDIEKRLFCKISGIKVMSVITTYHDSCGTENRFAPPSWRYYHKSQKIL